MVFVSLMAALAVGLAAFTLFSPRPRVSAYLTSPRDDSAEVFDSPNPLQGWVTGMPITRRMSEDNPELEQLIRDAGTRKTPREVVGYQLTSTLTAVVGFGVLTLVVAVFFLRQGDTSRALSVLALGGIFAVIAGVAAYTWFGPGALKREHQKRADHINRNSYQLMERVASALSSGASAAESLEFASQYLIDTTVKSEIDLTVAEIHSGVPIDVALRGLRERCRASEKTGLFAISAFVDALIANATEGTAISDDLNERAAALRRSKADTIMKRTTTVNSVVILTAVFGFAPGVLVALFWPSIYSAIGDFSGVGL